MRVFLAPGSDGLRVANSSQVQKSAEEIADEIYQTQTFQDSLTALDADKLSDFYRIEAADLTAFKVYVSGLLLHRGRNRPYSRLLPKTR